MTETLTGLNDVIRAQSKESDSADSVCIYRLLRRLKLVWLPKGRLGLILYMKRFNPGWGRLANFE